MARLPEKIRVVGAGSVVIGRDDLAHAGVSYKYLTDSPYSPGDPDKRIQVLAYGPGCEVTKEDVLDEKRPGEFQLSAAWADSRGYPACTTCYPDAEEDPAEVIDMDAHRRRSAFLAAQKGT